jgi:hypothetical protein
MFNCAGADGGAVKRKLGDLLHSTMAEAVSAVGAMDVGGAVGGDVVSVPSGEMFYPDKDLRLATRLRMRAPSGGSSAPAGTPAADAKLLLRDLHACATEGCHCAGSFYKAYGGSEIKVVVEVALAPAPGVDAASVDVADASRYIGHFRDTRPRVSIVYSDTMPGSSEALAQDSSPRVVSVTDSGMEWVASLDADASSSVSSSPAGSAFPSVGEAGYWRISVRPEKACNKKFAWVNVEFGLNAVSTSVFHTLTKPSNWLLLRDVPVSWGTTCDVVEERVREALASCGVTLNSCILRLVGKGKEYGWVAGINAAPVVASAPLGGGPLTLASASTELSMQAFLRLPSRSAATTAAFALAAAGRPVVGAGGVAMSVHRVLSMNKDHSNDASLRSVPVSLPSHCHITRQTQSRRGASAHPLRMPTYEESMAAVAKVMASAREGVSSSATSAARRRAKRRAVAVEGEGAPAMPALEDGYDSDGEAMEHRPKRRAAAAAGRRIAAVLMEDGVVEEEEERAAAACTEEEEEEEDLSSLDELMDCFLEEDAVATDEEEREEGGDGIAMPISTASNDGMAPLMPSLMTRSVSAGSSASSGIILPALPAAGVYVPAGLYRPSHSEVAELPLVLHLTPQAGAGTPVGFSAKAAEMLASTSEDEAASGSDAFVASASALLA